MLYGAGDSWRLKCDMFIFRVFRDLGNARITPTEFGFVGLLAVVGNLFKMAVEKLHPVYLLSIIRKLGVCTLRIYSLGIGEFRCT